MPFNPVSTRLIASLLASLTVISGFISPSHAESPEPAENLFAMSLQDVLSIGVATASKIEDYSGPTPANVTVITSGDINRYGYRTVGEAVNSVAGIFSHDLTLNTSFAMRGISNTEFTASSRVLVLIDGMRYNNWSFDEAYLNDTLPVDIESVERIEVLKGGASAVWGANAVYGVINIITKDPGKNSGRLVAETGSGARKKGYLSWSDTTEGGAAYIVSASATDINGRVAAYFPEFEAPDVDVRDDGNWDYTMLRTNAKFTYDKFFFNGLTSLYKSNLDSSSLFFGDVGTEEYVIDDTRLQTGYTFELDKASKSEVAVRGFFSNHRYNATFDYQILPDYFHDKYRIYEQHTGAEASYSQNITETLKGVVGAELIHVNDADEYFRSDLLDSAGSIIDTFQLDPNRRSRTIRSGFFDFNYQPTKEYGFFAGGRVDDTAQFGSAFSPRGAFLYQPRDPTVFKLLYSEGVRYPGIGESKIFEAEPQTLEPEVVQSYELLWEEQLNQRSTFKTSFFYNDLSDSIGFFKKENSFNYWTNYDGFDSKGVEMELRGSMTDSMSGFFSFMYARARDKENDSRIRNTPQYLGRLGLSLDYDEVVTLSPELAFGGKTEMPASETFAGHEFDPFFIGNIQLLAYPMGKSSRLSFGIYNIADKRFSVYSDRGRSLDVGREFRVALSVDL